MGMHGGGVGVGVGIGGSGGGGGGDGMYSTGAVVTVLQVPAVTVTAHVAPKTSEPEPRNLTLGSKTSEPKPRNQALGTLGSGVVGCEGSGSEVSGSEVFWFRGFLVQRFGFQACDASCTTRLLKDVTQCIMLPQKQVPG